MEQQTPAGFRLIPCDRDGRLSVPMDTLPPAIVEACNSTADLYNSVGFQPPWVGYAAFAGADAIGGGAFVGPPVNRRAEIAYFTLEEYRGRGFATSTARALAEIARAADPGIELFAKTAPEANASVRILQKLGFAFDGVVEDHEIGEAWAWILR